MKRYEGSYFSYFLMYMFYYLSMAFFSGLISVYLMDKGFSASDVSLVVASSYILSMITQPFIGDLCDLYDKKIVNMILLLISAVFCLVFIFMKSIYLIAIVYSIVLAILNGINPILERMATVSKHKYGLLRIWGTIGYASGTQVSGLIYRYISPYAMFIFFIVSIILCALGIMGTKDVKVIEKQTNTKYTFKDVILNKKFLYYLIIVCLFYGAANVNVIYLPAMLQDSGLSVSNASTVIFLATMAELPLILFSNLYMNKIGNKQLLIIDFVLLVIQFAAYVFIPSLSIKIIITILTKSLATMSFIMINMKVVATIVSQDHQIKALAIVSTFKSFTSIVFQTISGYIIDLSSYQLFYVFLLVCSFIGLILCLLYKIPDGNEHQLFD